MLSLPKPKSGEYNAFYKTYISKIDEEKVISMLKTQVSDLQKLLSPLSNQNESYRYAEGKWSIKEVVRHIIDTERVFAYRVMCIGRGDKGNLPRFDQNNYINESSVDHLTLNNLLMELSCVRQSTIHLAENMEESAWQRLGTASSFPVSACALFYMLVGHFQHHMDILNERYLPHLQ